MNRGIARRTVFESGADVREFLAQDARAVLAGWIEVRAYCLMATHFDLLVPSPAGALSTAMRAVQNEYVRWFNRRRRRDGALFRWRFRSKVVEGLPTASSSRATSTSTPYSPARYARPASTRMRASASTRSMGAAVGRVLRSPVRFGARYAPARHD